MNTRWCVTAVVAATVACSVPTGRVGVPSSPSSATQPIAIQVLDRGAPAIRHVSLEEYVVGTLVAEFVPRESDASIVDAMYEVQALVSRTFGVTNRGRHARDGYDLCATTHCQRYDPALLRSSRWSSAAAVAVQRTAGVVLWYGNAPARALFHADCGGHTSAAASVWGGRDHPYLTAVSDDGPAKAAHAVWRYAAPHSAVMDALNTDARTTVGDRLDTIEVLDRDAGGRAERVALHGRREVIVRGEEFRAVLARTFGARSVRSALFDVRRDGDQILFEGRGFGHGVGLCQAGAISRLRAGATSAAVLRRYFPGTRLARLK